MAGAFATSVAILPPREQSRGGSVLWMRRRLRPRPNDRTLTVDGVTRTIAEWALLAGITPGTLHARLRTGWSEREAVSPRTHRWRQRIP